MPNRPGAWSKRWPILRRQRHSSGDNYGFGCSRRTNPLRDPLLTVEDVAARLNVTKDRVWDRSSRKAPYLPVIRMSDGVLRYRPSEVEEFISERERLSALRSRRRQNKSGPRILPPQILGNEWASRTKQDGYRCAGNAGLVISVRRFSILKATRDE